MVDELLLVAGDLWIFPEEKNDKESMKLTLCESERNEDNRVV